MSDLPYMPFFVSDYALEAGHLTDEEHGAYLRLRILAWSSPGCRMPNDDEWLARRLSRPIETVRTLYRRVLNELWECDGNWLSRADLKRAYERGKANSSARSVSAKARWNKEKPSSKCNASKLKLKKENLESSFTSETPTPRATETGTETEGEPEPPSPTAPAPAEGKTKASPEPRGTRLPATGWKLTPEMAQHARDNGLSDDEIRAEALKFRDHWLGVPGAKGRKADWPATWRNWCRNAMEWRPARTSGQQPRAAPIDPRLAARIAESKARADAISSAEAAGLNPLDEQYDRHVGALMLEWYNNEQRRSA